MTTIRAQLASPVPGLYREGFELPSDIQWMPPGRHTITALAESGSVTMTVEVNETLAKKINSIFQTHRARAAAGHGDLPFFDLNHDDREASGHPTEFYWGGSDPISGGIRAKVAWTEAGVAALKGKLYRRFSPEFHVNKAGEIVGVGINMGGLVNKAAFQTIQPIWSKDGSVPGQEQEKTIMPKTVEEQLAEINSAVTGLATTVSGLAATVNEIKAKAGTPDAKILTLETQLAGLAESAKIQAKDAAKAKVQAAVAAGKIPAQNTELQTKWENLIVVDAKNADLLEALPANPALQQVVQAGAQPTSGGPEHPFLVKAKAFGESNKITDHLEAQSRFAGTKEGAELYESYRISLRK